MAPRRDYTTEEINLALTAFALEAGRQKPVEKLIRAAKLSIPFRTIHSWAYDVHKDRYEQIAVEVEKQVRTRMVDQYHRLAQMSSELSEEMLGRIKGLLHKKDDELKKTTERLEECEDELKELAAEIDAAQVRMAVDLELPDADALIEDILGEPEGLELDKELTTQLTVLYKRRDSIVSEMQNLWKRQQGLEVSFKDLAKILHESGVMGGIATEKLQLLTGQATDRVEHSFPELQRALEAKGIRLAVGQGAPRALPAPVIDV